MTAACYVAGFAVSGMVAAGLMIVFMAAIYGIYNLAMLLFERDRDR